VRADASLNLPSHFVSLDAAMLSLPLSRKFSVQAALHFLLCLYSVQASSQFVEFLDNDP